MNEPVWISAAAKRIVAEWDEWKREAEEKAGLDPEEAARLMVDSVAHAMWMERRRAGEP